MNWIFDLGTFFWSGIDELIPGGSFRPAPHFKVVLVPHDQQPGWTQTHAALQRCKIDARSRVHSNRL